MANMDYLATYTVVERSKGETYFLNHACLSSLSFGSEEMQWTGSHGQALEMLKECRARFKGQYRRFSVLEVC